MTSQDLTPQPSFDYGELCKEDWQFVHDASDEIRRLGTQTVENVLAIGKHLTEVKARLTHGQFGRWLASEFAWSERTAQRFMQSHEVFQAKPTPVSDLVRYLDPSAVYQLAAPSTPEAARAEVLEKVQQGERITPQQVQVIVREHKVQIPTPSTTKGLDGSSQHDRDLARQLHERQVKTEEANRVAANLGERQWSSEVETAQIKATILEAPLPEVRTDHGIEFIRPQRLNWFRDHHDVDEVADWLVQNIGPERLHAIVEAIQRHPQIRQPKREPTAQAPVDAKPEQAAIEATAEPEQRISPRTGKPVRPYRKRSAS